MEMSKIQINCGTKMGNELLNSGLKSLHLHLLELCLLNQLAANNRPFTSKPVFVLSF